MSSRLRYRGCISQSHDDKSDALCLLKRLHSCQLSDVGQIRRVTAVTALAGFIALGMSILAALAVTGQRAAEMVNRLRHRPIRFE